MSVLRPQCILYFEKDYRAISEVIAASTKCNAVIIKKILFQLPKAGLVKLRQAPAGSPCKKAQSPLPRRRASGYVVLIRSGLIPFSIGVLNSLHESMQVMTNGKYSTFTRFLISNVRLEKICTAHCPSHLQMHKTRWKKK